MSAFPIFTQYEDYLRTVSTQGRPKTDRTGVGTIGIFGYQMRWNLAHGFPLVTTKRVPIRVVIEELLWFLNGSTNNNELLEKNVHIWDEWARADGSLGPVYGAQWRSWPGKPEACFEEPTDGRSWEVLMQGGEKVHFVQKPIDQIQIALDTLRKSPDSRRIIVSAWNVADLPDMALAPCHCLFQFNTEIATPEERENYGYANSLLCSELDGSNLSVHSCDAHGLPKYRLSLHLYQRSCDSFLGVPFNIASYAFLLHMVAQQVDMIPGDFIWTGGDCHIYSNHHEQVALQLSRDIHEQPDLKLKKASSLFEYKAEDFEMIRYNPHAAIKAEVAV